MALFLILEIVMMICLKGKKTAYQLLFFTVWGLIVTAITFCMSIFFNPDKVDMV